MAGSCNMKKKKRLNENVTLRKGDKIPYGTYVAYEDLKYLFPYADVTVNQKSPAHYSSFINDYTYSTDANPRKALYIIITPEFNPDQREYEALLRFVGAGNHVFISSFNWGQEFIDSLSLEINQSQRFYMFGDS